MATLDLTLDKMRFPGIENFNPEFGTKETMGRGVHSVNLSENDMMPFLLQRPVSVVENSSTSDIEADRKLAIETSGVTLTLGRPSYPGCKVTVYGSFSSGTATVAYDKDANDVSSVVVGAGEHVELEANALRFFEVKAPAMSELVVASGTLSQAKTIPLGYASDAKLAFKVVFPQGHNDATSADSLTLNGIAVVSNQNGTLAPIPHHAMTEGGSTVYKVLDPNTTLEMYYTADYDGNGTPAFVIVGNPLVLSSSTYSIYANGQNAGAVTTESSTEISKINNKSLMDSTARLLAASKSKVTVGKKTSAQVFLGSLYGTVLSFDLANDEFPLFIGQAAGAAGSLFGGVCYEGDKQRVFVSASNAGFNGQVELYYIKIS